MNDFRELEYNENKSNNEVYIVKFECPAVFYTTITANEDSIDEKIDELKNSDYIDPCEFQYLNGELNIISFDTI